MCTLTRTSATVHVYVIFDNCRSATYDIWEVAFPVIAGDFSPELSMVIIGKRRTPRMETVASRAVIEDIAGGSEPAGLMRGRTPTAQDERLPLADDDGKLSGFTLLFHY